MNQKTTKVVVAGAGPAGSICAFLLHRSKIDVTLIDKAVFPRDKLCGGGLTYKAYQLLNEIYPNLKYDYKSIRHLWVNVENKATCEFDAALEIRIVNRKAFDNELLQQFLQAGGHFVNEGLKGIEEKDDGKIIVTLSNGEQLVCDYLIGADGANSQVRKYLNPNPGSKTFILEQYMEKGTKDQIEIGLSKDYRNGYFYRFPNNDFDAVGFGDYNTTVDRFRALLKEKGLQETKLQGAFITIDTDYPLNDHILLIGDAGGFCNRVTGEGLFYAFQTAKNAHEAILSNQPFRKVNKLYFRKKRQEYWKARLFYSRFGMKVAVLCCRWPRFVKYCFDKNV